jgi:outer membrane protein assembly factor BamB
VHNRGISFYGDKVFAATFDGRLIAIDAKTGEPVWSTRTFPEDAALPSRMWLWRPCLIVGDPNPRTGRGPALP